MPDPIKSGDDVTKLMNEIPSGTDVTHLMGGISPEQKAYQQPQQPGYFERFVSGMKHDPLEDKPVTLGDIRADPSGSFWRAVSPEHLGAMTKEAAYFPLAALGMKAAGAMLPAGKFESIPATKEMPAPKQEMPIQQQLPELVNAMHPAGDAPALEEVHAATAPKDNISPPGGFKSKDTNWFGAQAGSSNQILSAHPESKPVADALMRGVDDAAQSRATNTRYVDRNVTQGLNNDQLERLGRASEGQQVDISDIPQAAERLANWRKMMDDFFAKAKIERSGDMGYIQDYFPHIAKLEQEDPDMFAGIKDIFNYRQGKNALKSMFEKKDLAYKEGTGEVAGAYGQGVGSVGESPFTKTRTGQTEDLVDWNMNRVARAYIDSLSREIYIRPAVEEAKAAAAKLPDSMLKELSEKSIKNVTRFDASPELSKATRDFTHFVMDTTSRSMMSFNPWLQWLHFTRLGPAYVELGTRDFAGGIGNILKNPAAAYRETAEAGLLPNEIYPPRMQTMGEKIDSIGNFKSYVDFLDRSILYNGFKNKFMRSGMEPEVAQRQALQEAKRASFTVDPARATMGLTPEPTNILGQLATQYKRVPMKIVEWAYNTAAEMKQNPPKAARLGALLAAAGASHAAGGPAIFHLPTSLTNWSLPVMSQLAKVLAPLASTSPDIEKSLAAAAEWITPGGEQIGKALK